MGMRKKFYKEQVIKPKEVILCAKRVGVPPVNVEEK